MPKRQSPGWGNFHTGPHGPTRAHTGPHGPTRTNRTNGVGVPMSCVRVLPPVQKHLVTTSTTDVYEWFTEWMPAIGLDESTIVMKIAELTGNFRATPCVQTAMVRTDKPNAPVVLTGGPITSSVGTFFGTTTFPGGVTIASTTAGQTFVRFGVMYDLSSAPSTGQADVTLQVTVKQCGRLLAPWSGHVVATTTNKVFQPITPWLAGLGAVEVEGTFVLNGLANIDLRLTYRTADTSPEDPNAWNATGVGTTYTGTTDIEDNDGEQSLTVSGAMWVQVGFWYTLTSGGTPFGQADVNILLGIRSS